jgi:hypothetical protein
VDLSEADLSEADLGGFSLVRIDFSRANLARARLTRASLWKSRLRGANLTETNLGEADLTEAELDDVNLSSAFLNNARCNVTDFRRSSLVGANLAGTLFSRCRMDGADLSRAVCGNTVWADTDLRGVRSFEAMEHLGPSTIGLDTVVASGGAIPESFLRGCGLPDPVIAYVGSLGHSQNPIQLYSCFISYSAHDQEFCERLHTDLQAAGVRCWFAAEDMKIGDRFRDAIESAIRMHDKLLLVLSDNSVKSDWVRSEVEGAFERETRERKPVLFPVRLDEAVMDTPNAWAADIRRQRHIADFSRWKDHDAYKRAFDRLLRDLRAAPNT